MLRSAKQLRQSILPKATNMLAAGSGAQTQSHGIVIWNPALFHWTTHALIYIKL